MGWEVLGLRLQKNLDPTGPLRVALWTVLCSQGL